MGDAVLASGKDHIFVVFVFYFILTSNSVFYREKWMTNICFPLAIYFFSLKDYSSYERHALKAENDAGTGGTWLKA